MDVMPRRHPLRACVLAALALACAAPLAGCGSSTTTVTAASTPSQPPTTSTTPTVSRQTATTSNPGTTTTSPTGGAAAPTTTRTAPEPEFAQQETKEGVAGAQAKVRSLGYTASNPSEYHPSQTLKVLVGTRTGSGDGYGQLAFFFVGNRYIGTDVKVPSAKIAVVSQSESEVTVAYPLYRRGDPLCCPGAGQAKVRFQLNNGHLQPLDAIPPAVSAAGTGRN